MHAPEWWPLAGQEGSAHEMPTAARGAEAGTHHLITELGNELVTLAQLHALLAAGH